MVGPRRLSVNEEYSMYCGKIGVLARITLGFVFLAALSTANVGCVVVTKCCGSACCKKAAGKCPAGCTKPCCKTASKKCPDGCTKPCCKKT